MQQTTTEQSEKDSLTNAHTAGNITDLLARVTESADMVNFLSSLAQNKNLKKLLSLRLNDLFLNNEGVVAPYFHICSLPLEVMEDEKQMQPSKKLNHIISSKMDNLEHRSKTILKGYFGEDESWEEISVIACYFLVDFIRKNPKLIKLINSPQLNYATVNKEIQSPEDPIKLFEYLITVYNKIEDSEIVDPIIKDKLKKFISILKNKVINKVDTALDQLNNLTPNVMMPMHMFSVLSIKTLLTRTNISYEDYIEALDDLYMYHQIDNKSFMTWCENCSESQQYSIHMGRFAPDKIIKAQKCRNCLNKESFGSLYGLSPLLRDIIFLPDGFLSVYFAWLLDSKYISFNANHRGTNYETDFIVKDSVLVECKMYKADKDDGAVISSVSSAIGQIKSQIKKLATEGIQIKKAYLLWNRFRSSKDIMEEINRRFPEMVRDYHFKIISPSNIEAFTEGLKAGN